MFFTSKEIHWNAFRYLKFYLCIADFNFFYINDVYTSYIKWQYSSLFWFCFVLFFTYVWSIIFIFVGVVTKLRPLCPPAFIRYLSEILIIHMQTIDLTFIIIIATFRSSFPPAFIRYVLGIIIIYMLTINLTFIIIIIVITFWPLCPPTFFRCLLIRITYRE